MRNGEISTQLMRVFKLVFIGILFILPETVWAQYDYEHYVPPFYCSGQVGKQELFLSTNSTKELKVFVEDGQGNAVAGPFTISRNQSDTYVFKTPSGASYSSHNLGSYPNGCSYSYGIIGPKELNKPIDGYGLRIYSYDGPFFANIRHGFSNGGEGGALTHGGSLSAKGAYAKGKEFYSGHLYDHTVLYNANNNYSGTDPLYNGRYPIRSHFISVMAVEEGLTEVKFSGIKCKYITKYEGGKVILKTISPTDTITVSLSKGQSYVVGVNLHGIEFHNESIEVLNGMNGTHILSTQKIVVNCGSWTAGAKPSQDIGFDQIVPVDQVRDKYIVMKGEGRAEPNHNAYHAGQERTIVVATKENTEVFVNGNSKGTLDNPGDFMILDDIVNPIAIPTLYIDTKGKDVYVYQTMCGTNQDWTNIGLNFIPPLTGLGIKEVVIPKANYITSGDVINPTVTVLAQKNVDVQRNGISLSNPQNVPGTTEWVYYKVPNISGDCRFTGSKAINVAWTASSNTLGAAGYYSGFTKAVSPIHPVLNIDTELSLICESYDADISISIKEPLPDFYEWYVNDITGDPIIENGPLVVPAPDVETIYHVLGYYRDPSLDLLFNGDFSDGFNGFDSDYDLVTGNLVDPGDFALASVPVAENPALGDFGAMDGGRMFLGYSDRQGEVVYQVNELPVEENFSYIFKLHGRLAQKNSPYNQTLKILINDEVIIDGFKIDKFTEWQSVSALWKPGTARKATIKILNHNLDNQDAFFALDSISFVQAVQADAAFVAKVVPNFSYGSDGDIVHFCSGVQNSLDVSNGDTSWYDYSWSKDGVDLIDGTEFTGVKSHELVFTNPQKSQEGEYKCTIGFKEEYQDCGTSDATVDVTLTVFIDDAATVSIDADQTSFCSGASTDLNALVTGDSGGVKWYVDGGTSPVSLENPYAFNYPTGTYTVRCEAENGCGVVFDEVVINVLSSPDLVSLTSNDNLCVGENIVLTALATGDGTLTYNWKKGSETLTETGNVLTYTAAFLDRESAFSVNVSSVYNIAGETVVCANSLTLAVLNLDIIPLVEFDKLLEGATICERDNYSFSVGVKYTGDFYNYSWVKDGVSILNNLSSLNLSNVSPADAGNYRVNVTNQCNSEFSAADLIVIPEIKVNDFNLDKTGPFCTATSVTATFDVDDTGAVYIYQAIEPGGATTIITNPYTFTVDASNQGGWEFLVSSSCDALVSFTSNLNMHEDFGTLTVADIGTCIGETITFEASVSSIPVASELHYAWTDNLGNPIGTNSDQLEITNVQDANFGTYTVVLTDQCGNSKTDSADLTKEAVTSPATAAVTTVCETDNFSTTITYLGSPIFEWRFNDPVSGAIKGTTETLSLTNVSLAQAGIYYCNVTLICGTNVVIQRELKVNAHISLVDPSDVTINVCEGTKPVLTLLNSEINGNLDDYSIVWKNYSGTNVGTGTSVQLDVHNTPGPFLYTATVVGKCESPIKTFNVIVHDKPAISVADNSISECSGSISLDVLVSGEHNGIVWWKDGVVITDGNADPDNFVINPATSPLHDGDYIAKVESDYCGDAQVSINLDIRNTIVVSNQSPANTEVCENDATNLFVTAAGDNIVYKWYKTTDPATTLSDQANYDLGNIVFAQAGEYKCDLSNDLNCGNQILTFDVQVRINATVTNPLRVTMCETDPNPVFSVTGTGEAPLTYQWYDKDDIAVTGATSNSLTVTTPVNGQSYYCIVSGSSCNDATSNTASLTIIKDVAVTDPLDLTISDGANAGFSVVASGEPSYTYQWQENDGGGWNDLTDGGKYSGVNLFKLQITGADKATFDGYKYRCIVSTSGIVCIPTVTSGEAILTITEVTKIAVQPAGITVCFDTNASISVEGTTAGLTYTWFYKKGGAGVYETADGKDGISISQAGLVSTLTILADDLDINNWMFKCEVSDGVSADQESNEIVIRVLEDIAVATADAAFTPCVNNTFSMTVSATGDAIKYKWYKVGAESTILSTSVSYNLGNIITGDAGTYKCEIYNDLGCNDQVRTFVVDVKNHATITNPADVTMCANDVDPAFTVNGTAEGTLTYEWFDKDDNLIVGATSNILTVTSPVNGQSYYAVASGDFCDNATSNSASLTVLAEVSTTNPVDVTIADGGTASFEVTASGEPTYSYQWQEDSGSGFTDITDVGEYSGATSSKLTIAGALDANGFDDNLYRCIVTSSSCSGIATSLHATLNLDNIIKILVQPDNQKVCETNTATFAVEGTAVVTGITWRYDNGFGYADADGVLGMSVSTVGLISTLSVPNTDPSMNTWKFKCVLTDGLTFDHTNEVNLEVYETINVTTAINNNLQKCEGESLVLSVVTDAGSNIQYKWYESTAPGTVLSTSADFDLGNISLANEQTYKCLVYNDLACGDVIISYTIDVQEDAAVTNPADQIVCASETNIDFTVTGTAEGTVTYEWFDKDDIFVGNAATLTVAVPVHGQSYYCVVSGNACNDATSEIATLTVYEEVSIVDQPLDVTIPDGGNASFTVNVAGEPDYTYQWYEDSGSGWNVLSNGGKYSGVDSETLLVGGADQVNFNGNEYRCEVTNLCNAVESAVATLTITSVVKISGQPDNREACLSGAVGFEITGKTSGLNYNWEYSADGVVYTIVTGVPELNVVTDANGSILEIAATTLAMNSWTFRCIVSDGVSVDETSSVASLNVVEPVSFDAVADENLCFGIEKQISLVNLSGTEPISFSWMKDVTEVSTTSTVNIGAADNGNYQITAGNGGVCPDKTNGFVVSHYDALTIAAWSNATQVCIGQSEALTVGINTIDLAKTASYKWYKDGVLIGTDPSFNLVAADKTQSGQYKVEVSDGCSTETVFGYVNVYETISGSNTWNTETTLCLGTELKLETKVTGDVTTFAWTKDGVGFTASSTYLKSNVDAADAGTYVCTVSGNCGADIIYTIKVNILATPEITTGIDLITAVCEGDPLVLGPIAVNGTFDDLIWTLNDNSTNAITGARLDLGTAELSEAGNYLVTVSNSCGSDASLGTQEIYPRLTLDPITSQTVCEGNDLVFRANATGASIDYQWLVEGVDQLVNSSELIIDASDVQPLDLNTSKTYNVVCNITSTTGCGVASQATTLLVKPNTVLHATLKNVVKYVGENYTMNVDVTGTNLVFEWIHEKLDGSPDVLLPETGSSVILTNITMADAGYYTCKIVGACGQRLASGKLTVKEPVTVISGLNALEEKCVGDPLNLSLNVTGQISSIKWFKNNVLIPSETSLNLFISAVGLTDAAIYKCEIEGEGVNGVITETTTVRVYSQTVLNSPLDDRSLCEGVSMDWIPDVNGTSNMTFQWTFDGVNVFNQKMLHYDALTLSNEGNYEVQVTSMCGDVSSSANLEIIELPVFVSATAGKDVCENEPLVEFTVEYTGEKLKYQWRKNGVDLPGKTTQNISLTNIRLLDGGDYNCRVYSNCGEEFSPAAALNVTAQLQVLSDQVDMEVCAGEDVLFTADVVGHNVNYQWKVDGVDITDVPGEITGTNTSSLSIVSSQVAHSGYYTCILSDNCTDYRSTKPTELLVNAPPNTEIFGRMVLCAKEDRVTYVTNDQPDITYAWGVEGGIFAGPEEGVRTRITWEEISDGNLSVTIIDLATGCKSRVDSAVVLNALPSVNFTSIDSKGVCEKEFELTGGFPDGGIYWVNGISQTVFNPSDRGAGTYAVHYSYTDGNGCSNVTPLTDLTVDIRPVVDITDDITVGSCNPTLLTAKTDEDNIQWFKLQDNNRILPDNLNNPNSMSPTFTPGESQVLLALVKDEHGCEGIDLLNLTVAPLPVVTTINDTTVGQCNQLLLLTDIVGDQDVISWTNPDHLDHSDIRSPKIIDAPAGTHTYAISVTDLYGCDAAGEVTVTMFADPTLGEDQFGCEGDQYEVDITGMQNPVWDDNDTSPIRTIDISGQYLLEVSNEYGCGDEQLFVINPKLNLGLRDTLIFEGQTVTFAPNLPFEYRPYRFEWQNNSIAHQFEVSETGTYKLIVIDSLDCVTIDSAFVEVKQVGIESANAFLPTSSGENNKFYLDQYRLNELGVIQDFEMYVYDRWGELLYKTDSVEKNAGWDGTYKGKLCPTGAYVWIVFINGKLTNKGTFMLIR